MDGVTLLERARGAGLTVAADGDKLIVKGPKAAGPVAREVLSHKAAVLAALTPPPNSHYLQNGECPTDPRPDLADDSPYWTVLLRWAWIEDNQSALGALHGVRCCGAVLELQASGALRIVAGAEYLGVWEDDRQKWLAPHREAIGRWLKVMADGEREAA
ncbi:MAG: hypothetical protein AVDCRST_MAG77-2862 [uncultured Chloroflexi bacterium]|uniref:TubC N-terminal docking domain-containing protein n=1 Tax=uncultured Chloroflexota bacterium TaxID=166587 RepID=A0A6J4J0E3_9CHLR|nr:MAG: hypothetical protein AVDCRST_MAG77-2862 [uncultured Chloroflexota bacterium]